MAITVDSVREESERLSRWRGDNESHHAYTDDVAYDLLILLATGTDLEDVRDILDNVLEEYNWMQDEAGMYGGWWYA